LSTDKKIVENKNWEEKEILAKNAMKAGEYQKAADLWSDVLEQRVAFFGDTAKECASSYYQYGKSLIDVVRSQIDVLGEIVKKDLKKSGKNHQGLSESSSDEEEEQQTTNDTLQDLEIAWDALEMSRIIYSSSGEHTVELADVHLALGDLSMESDNMPQAVVEYEKCLAIQQLNVPSDDRRLAETHFLIGIAEDYQNNLKEALSHFRLAYKILDSRIIQLQKDVSDSSQTELTDLQASLLELGAKIEDLSKSERTPFPLVKDLLNTKEPTLKSSHIQDAGVVAVTNVPTKRKLVTQENPTSSKKPNLSDDA